MAKKLNLELDQGSDSIIKFNWVEDGVAVDLTGYSATMHIRYKNDESLAVELSTTNSKIALSTYEVTVTIEASDTYSLEIKPMHYDLIMQKGAITKKIVEGEVTLNKLITLYNG